MTIVNSICGALDVDVRGRVLSPILLLKRLDAVKMTFVHSISGALAGCCARKSFKPYLDPKKGKFCLL